MNYKMSKIIECKYDDVQSFNEGLAEVSVEDEQGIGKRGFIDKTGKEAVPPIYDGVRLFSENIAAVNLQGKWGFIGKM